MVPRYPRPQSKLHPCQLSASGLVARRLLFIRLTGADHSSAVPHAMDAEFIIDDSKAVRFDASQPVPEVSPSDESPSELPNFIRRSRRDARGRQLGRQ